MSERRACYPIGYGLLRERREFLGWTLRDLEQRSGVTFSRISRIERGAGADEDMIQALCRALGLSFHPATIFPAKERKEVMR